MKINKKEGKWSSLKDCCRSLASLLLTPFLLCLTVHLPVLKSYRQTEKARELKGRRRDSLRAAIQSSCLASVCVFTQFCWSLPVGDAPCSAMLFLKWKTDFANPITSALKIHQRLGGKHWMLRNGTVGPLTGFAPYAWRIRVQRG